MKRLTLGLAALGNLAALTAPILTPSAQAQAALAGVIISEARFRGPGGSGDEFVELYNTVGRALDISGWSIQTNTATGDAPALQTTLVPQGTMIPPRGHFLFTGQSYSLGRYGSGDASILGDASNDSGAALFNAVGNKQDAIGFASSNPMLREGAGLLSAPINNSEHSLVRDYTETLPKDTPADSSQDFLLVTTDTAVVPNVALDNADTGTGTVGTAGNIVSRLGAPSPQGLSSPIYTNFFFSTVPSDPSTTLNEAPNRVRTGSGNSGSLLFRRRLTNTSRLTTITRLRLSVIRITGPNAPLLPGETRATQADVRLISSAGGMIAFSNGTRMVSGTTLESGGDTTTANGPGQGPSQPGDGGLGSSSDLSFDVILNRALAPGEGADYEFALRIAKTGNYNLALNFEALSPPSAVANLTATPGNNQVALSWTGVSSAASYKVFRSTSAGTYNFTAPLATGITASTYTDTTATNGTTYFYVVRATSGGGDGPNSNEVSAIPSVPPPSFG